MARGAAAGFQPFFRPAIGTTFGFVSTNLGIAPHAADPSLSPAELAERVGASALLAKKALERTPQPRAPDGRRKIDCARRLLAERPDLSAKEIARRCRCDHTLVLAARDRPR